MLLQKSDIQKTAHHTFRINQDILLVIKKEGRDRGISMNSLVGQILSNYVERDRYFAQLGFIPMSKDVLRKFFSRVKERYLIEDSKELGSIIQREYVSYIFHKVDIDTLLKFLDLWFGRFGSYQHKVNGNSHWFAVNHNINVQFSKFMEHSLRALIEPVLSKPLNFTEVLPNVVCFSLDT